MSRFEAEQSESRMSWGSRWSDPRHPAKRPKTMREIEMEVIFQVLDKQEGDKPKAAAELGIALKTLYNKLNSYTETHPERLAG